MEIYSKEHVESVIVSIIKGLENEINQLVRLLPTMDREELLIFQSKINAFVDLTGYLEMPICKNCSEKSDQE